MGHRQFCERWFAIGKSAITRAKKLNVTAFLRYKDAELILDFQISGNPPSRYSPCVGS